ncbi:MAG: nodulation protein NfeD [Chloroflexi bacterium]|nr:nodulation protein NfeD [Chloroflexota bacterium]MBI3740940.1 nodulation protein NfeD [Chloroflexota bacterium]
MAKITVTRGSMKNFFHRESGKGFGEMQKWFRGLVGCLALIAILVPARTNAQRAGAFVDVLTVNGAIDTWIEGYINRGIGVAEQDGAEAVVIVLNTPGGALGAMQNITTRMLNARVPVIIYVAPAGAAAASAGTFITLAANVAAMAPGTTIGAAHPVAGGGANIEGDERAKITNYSVALIQNIARERNHNADWAAKAVRDSIAATAQEALELKVIDLIATDQNDLLNKLDGRKVKTAAGERTLQTLRAGATTIELNFAEIFFHTLVDPNIALILLQIGLLAIAVELYNPGATIPAITGGICLVLAFVALGNLPVNWGGVILIVLSVVVFILDVKVNSFVLTAGGIVMFILGGLLLFTPFTPIGPTLPEVSINPLILFGAAGAMAVFFVFLLGAAVRGKKYPVLSGAEVLVGANGFALSDLAPNGTVQVKSEQWSAVAESGAIEKGAEIRVVALEGLRLKVVKK